jgi:hypothetical protein
MSNKAHQLRIILTKGNLTVDETFNMFNLQTLHDLTLACIALELKLGIEKMSLTSQAVKDMVDDDIKVLNDNFKVINSAIKLKRLELHDFCIN